MSGNMTETDNIRERLITLTRDLVLIPGTATRIDDLDRCFDFVKKCINNTEDLEVNEYRHNGLPSIVAMPRSISEPEVLLISHLDVINHSDLKAYNPTVETGKYLEQAVVI